MSNQAYKHDAPKYTNRLIHESSPYLAHHAHNPVDWYPWGEEAFARAKHVAKVRVVNQRLIPVTMEPRGSIGEFDAHYLRSKRHRREPSLPTAFPTANFRPTLPLGKPLQNHTERFEMNNTLSRRFQEAGDNRLSVRK